MFFVIGILSFIFMFVTIFDFILSLFSYNKINTLDEIKKHFPRFGFKKQKSRYLLFGTDIINAFDDYTVDEIIENIDDYEYNVVSINDLDDLQTILTNIEIYKNYIYITKKEYEKFKQV